MGDRRGKVAETFCRVFLVQLFLSWFVEASDVTSLLEFRNGLTSDPGGLIRSTWDANKLDGSGCPFQWHGVSCSNGRVDGLLLNDLSLVGGIALGTLGKLAGLATLVLSNNSLTGNLPGDLGDLGALQVLDLSNNMFTGDLPGSLSSLRNLRNFSVAGNKLEGPVPDELFTNWTRLQDLDLSGNSFLGNLPSSLSKLQELMSLNIASNAFSGLISSELRSLGSLQKLDLHQNRLSGQVDPVLMGLRKLAYIDVSSNRLSGMLPWQQDAPMVFPQGISYANLSFNEFSGELAPENAANLFANSLETLDVSNNRLSGKLPSFAFTFSIKVLKLQNNAFSGFVPTALFSAESVLQELDVSSNNLSGPVEIITATSLSILKLGSNKLTGALPIRLGSCAVVDLSNNSFSGGLSVMRKWGDGLQELDLSMNLLSGVLANETAHLLRLMHLNISHNNLSGSIPSFYASNYRKLTTLDLSFNALEGEIPGEYFHSQSLSVLKLANNRLVGGLPVAYFTSSSALPGELLSPASTTSSSAPPAILFSPLQVIDFSSNFLNGTIPREIASLAALETINLSKNNLTGEIPAQLSLLRYLEDLDLSFNHLTGHIPEHLPKSLLKLNLSENDLSGLIPADLWSKFPRSSFFPGNAGLRVPAYSSQGPARTYSRRHKGMSSAVKAGLIGGCISAAVIIFAIAMFVYRRRTSRFQDVEKGFQQRDITLKSQSPQFVAQLPARAKISREQLLAGENISESGPSDQAIYAEGLDLERSSPSRKRNWKQPESSSTFQQSPSLKARSPDRLAGDLHVLDETLVFTAEELSSAPAEVLGRSSHGTSYKATLENGHVLTVKWLREGLAKDKSSFTREAKKLGSIQHPNILPLKGYYWGPKEHEKLIVSDFLSQGSLADRLSERSGRRFPPLDWLQRLRIANDIARGLSHLHLRHKLPHGNLKVTNVLLDSPALVARLSDYSIHQLMTPAGTANQILNAGALGYRAPELANTRKPKPTLAADVYALGVILMEMVTGKGAGDIICGNAGAVDLTDWVKMLVNEGRERECYDETLTVYGADEVEATPNGADRVLALAVRCISERSARPGIKTVQEELASIQADS